MKFSPLIIAFTLAVAVLGVAAQQRGRQQPPGVSLRLDTDLVTIDVVAVDKLGNFVRDLRADEFEVMEDGKPRKFDFFTMTDEAVLSRPLAVVFALDLSGSLKPEEADMMREAALRFSELMKGDSVFAAMTFNYEIKILQNFTTDPRRIERAFAKAENFGGSTRIYDAIDRAVSMLDRNAPRARKNRPVRRVVVVITDGFDSSSTIDKRELIRRAQAKDVTVYSITLPSYVLSAVHSQERVITPLDASRIVAATGGRDYAADANDFSPVFKAAADFSSNAGWSCFTAKIFQ